MRPWVDELRLPENAGRPMDVIARNEAERIPT